MSSRGLQPVTSAAQPGVPLPVRVSASIPAHLNTYHLYASITGSIAIQSKEIVSDNELTLFVLNTLRTSFPDNKVMVNALAWAIHAYIKESDRRYPAGLGHILPLRSALYSGARKLRTKLITGDSLPNDTLYNRRLQTCNKFVTAGNTAFITVDLTISLGVSSTEHLAEDHLLHQSNAEHVIEWVKTNF